MTVWRQNRDDLILHVRLSPGAAKDEVQGIWTDEKAVIWLSAKVRAVPEKGRANMALVALLAKWLDWPKGAILLESGDTNRLKRLRITGGALASERLAAIIEQRVEAS